MESGYKRIMLISNAILRIKRLGAAIPDAIGSLARSNLRVFLLPAIGLVFLLVLEIFARILGFGHPLIYQASSAGYEPKARQSVNRLFKISHYNAFGMRGEEITKKPLIGETRILTLGDSVNNGGTTVNDSQTYPAKLEARFRALGKQVSVLNASSGGWAIENAYRWTVANGVFGAKLVLLEVNEKDLDQSFVDSSILDNNLSFPSHYPTFALQEVVQRYLAPKLGFNRPSSDPGSTSGSFNRGAAQDVLKAVTELKKYVELKGAKLVIVYWDSREVSTSDEVSSARKAFFELAEAERIPVIRPLRDPMPIHAAKIYRDSIHPNEAGNDLIANEVFKYLLASQYSKHW